MRSIFYALLVFVFPLVFWGVGNAAAQGAAGKKDGKLRFSCLYWDGLPAEDLYYRERESYRKLEFKQGSRSKSFSLVGTPVFELYRKVLEPEEGKPPYELLTRTPLPKSKRVLFVVIPFDVKGAVRYKVVAMDDSLQAFPRGAFRFANFSSEALFVKCGDTVKKIPSNQTTVIRQKNKPNGGFVPFLIGNTKGKTIFGTRIFGQPSGRELVFISPPEKKGGMPRVKFISQLVAPPTPPDVP